MRFRAAVALVTVALALPVFAQHGAARGGFAAHGGAAGHAGFVGHSGFAAARGVSRSAPSYRRRGFARPSFGRSTASGYAGSRVPFRASRFSAYRPEYHSGNHGRSGRWDRDRRRGPQLFGSYAYPGWAGYPYPYAIDPGFYDWGDSSDQGSESNDSVAQNYADAPPDPGYDAGPAPMPEPIYGQPPVASAPIARPAYPGTMPSPEPQQAITVIFKSGRAPENIHNYLMNSRTLTDLDQQHYEQIPLNQIDVAATEEANRSRGLDFQVPTAARE